MRKFVSIITAALLCLTLLTGCQSEKPSETTVQPTDSTKESSTRQTEVPTEESTTRQTEIPTQPVAESQMSAIQEMLYQEQALCAVAYVGVCGGSFTEIQEGFVTEGLTEALPILAEVQEKNLICNEGLELYLVIPREGVGLTVYEQIMDVDTGEATYGETLFSQSETVPLLLRGNVSDIFPNMAILLEGQGGETVEYCPCLSLKDGSLSGRSMILDMTPYETLGIYTGPEFSGEDLCVTAWYGEAPNTAGETMLLELRLNYDGTATYAYGPAEVEYYEYFGGQWYDDGGKLVLELFGGPNGDPESHYDFRGEFLWDYDERYLNLTHADGSSLIFGLEGGNFRFTTSNQYALMGLWSNSVFVFEADEYIYRDLELMGGDRCNYLIHNGEGITYAAYEGSWSETDGELSIYMEMHSGNNYLDGVTQSFSGTYHAKIDLDGWLTLDFIDGDAFTEYMSECGLEFFEPTVSFG